MGIWVGRVIARGAECFSCVWPGEGIRPVYRKQRTLSSGAPSEDIVLLTPVSISPGLLVESKLLIILSFIFPLLCLLFNFVFIYFFNRVFLCRPGWP